MQSTHHPYSQLFFPPSSTKSNGVFIILQLTYWNYSNLSKYWSIDIFTLDMPTKKISRNKQPAEWLSSPVKIINTLKNVNNIFYKKFFLFKYDSNKNLFLWKKSDYFYHFYYIWKFWQKLKIFFKANTCILTQNVQVLTFAFWFK